VFKGLKVLVSVVTYWVRCFNISWWLIVHVFLDSAC